MGYKFHECPVCTRLVGTTGRLRLRAYDSHVGKSQAKERVCPTSCRLLVEICDILRRKELARRAGLSLVGERVDVEAYQDGVEAGVCDDRPIFNAFARKTAPKLFKRPSHIRMRQESFDCVD